MQAKSSDNLRIPEIKNLSISFTLIYYHTVPKFLRWG